MAIQLPAQDWPNLERFRAANAALAAPVAGTPRVVFMGNSITEGWLQDSTSFFHTEPDYVNRGISGQTTPQMLIRFRPDVIELRPDVVVILAGINDIAENTGPLPIEAVAGNLFSMAELAEAHGISVVLSAVLPADDFPWRPGMDPAPKVHALKALLKTYAAERGHVYLDYYNPLVNATGGLNPELAYDGVHPTAEGYRRMQALAEVAIREALEKRR